MTAAHMKQTFEQTFEKGYKFANVDAEKRKLGCFTILCSFANFICPITFRRGVVGRFAILRVSVCLCVSLFLCVWVGRSVDSP